MSTYGISGGIVLGSNAVDRLKTAFGGAVLFDLSKLDYETPLRDLVARLAAREADGDFQFGGEDGMQAGADPFAAGIEMGHSAYEDFAAWQAAEEIRMWQKSMMNGLGELQQDLAGQMPGWRSHQVGDDEETMPDLVGAFGGGKQPVIVEFKNKWNTLTGRARPGVELELEGFLRRPEFDGHRAILVEFITPVNRQVRWRPMSPGFDVVVMGGRVFYALAADAELRTMDNEVSAHDDMTEWESWGAVDLVAKGLFGAIQDVFGIALPDEVTMGMVGASLRH